MKKISSSTNRKTKKNNHLANYNNLLNFYDLLTGKWVYLVILITSIFLIVGFFNINDYWETTDEKFDQHIGQFYYSEWAKTGKDGLEKRFIPLQRNYGPFFDYIVVASHDFFYNKTQLVKNEVASYHIPTLVASSLLVLIVGLFAGYLFNPQVGILSSLILALLPRFIGDSQNNLKDTPLATFFTLSIALFYFAIRRRKLIYFLLAGISAGLTYSTKINGLLIFPTIGLFYLLERKITNTFKYFLKDVLFGFVSIFGFLGAILTVWPYYRFETIKRFQETLYTFQKHEWNEYVLYLGNHFRGQEIPWHYPFVMFGITTPVWYLFFFVVGLGFGIHQVLRNGRNASPFVLLVSWLFFAIMTQILSGAPMYDGIRHFLAAVPAICILSAYGIYLASEFIPKKYIAVYIGTIGFLFLLLLVKNISLHPYQIVYFNELIGGTKGAYRKFDLDYWGQSLKEGADWINRNAKDNSLIYLSIPMAHHFPIDSSRFSLVSNNYDYKVSLIRGMLHTFDPTEDYLHPNRKPVHEIKVDGAPILQIFHYPENATASYVKSLENFVKPLIIQKGVMQKVYEIDTNKLISDSIGNVQLDCAKPNKYFDKKRNNIVGDNS